MSCSNITQSNTNSKYFPDYVDFDSKDSVTTTPSFPTPLEATTQCFVSNKSTATNEFTLNVAFGKDSSNVLKYLKFSLLNGTTPISLLNATVVFYTKDTVEDYRYNIVKPISANNWNNQTNSAMFLTDVVAIAQSSLSITGHNNTIMTSLKYMTSIFYASIRLASGLVIDAKMDPINFTATFANSSRYVSHLNLTCAFDSNPIDKSEYTTNAGKYKITSTTEKAKTKHYVVYRGMARLYNNLIQLPSHSYNSTDAWGRELFGIKISTYPIMSLNIANGDYIKNLKNVHVYKKEAVPTPTTTPDPSATVTPTPSMTATPTPSPSVSSASIDPTTTPDPSVTVTPTPTPTVASTDTWVLCGKVEGLSNTGSTMLEYSNPVTNRNKKIKPYQFPLHQSDYEAAELKYVFTLDNGDTFQLIKSAGTQDFVISTPNPADEDYSVTWGDTANWVSANKVNNRYYTFNNIWYYTSSMSSVVKYICDFVDKDGKKYPRVPQYSFTVDTNRSSSGYGKKIDYFNLKGYVTYIGFDSYYEEILPIETSVDIKDSSGLLLVSTKDSYTKPINPRYHTLTQFKLRHDSKLPLGVIQKWDLDSNNKPMLISMIENWLDDYSLFVNATFYDHTSDNYIILGDATKSSKTTKFVGNVSFNLEKRTLPNDYLTYKSSAKYINLSLDSNSNTKSVEIALDSNKVSVKLYLVDAEPYNASMSTKTDTVSWNSYLYGKVLASNDANLIKPFMVKYAQPGDYAVAEIMDWSTLKSGDFTVEENQKQTENTYFGVI